MSAASITLNGAPGFNKRPEDSEQMSIETTDCGRSKVTDKIKEQKKLASIAHSFEWQPDIDLLSFEDASSNFTPHYQEKFPFSFDQTAFYYMDWALSKIPSNLVQSMEPHLQKMYFCMERHIKNVREERLGVPTSEWLAVDQTDKVSLRYAIRDSGPEGYLMCLIGRNLPFIMNGSLDPWELLNKDQKLEELFLNAPRIVHTYNAAGAYLKLLSHKNPHLSILQIGAGTGSATLSILRSLSHAGDKHPRFHRYIAADDNVNILREALKDQLNPWEDAITFADLNIDDDLVSQNYVAESHDIIIAAYTLHRRKSLQMALKNARKLLKPGGKLLILDVTKEQMSSSLIFGTLSSWWTTEEQTRQRNPVLSANAWELKLLANGFSGLDTLVCDDADESIHQNSLMVSTARRNECASATIMDVLIVCEDDSYGISLLHLLRSLAGLNLKFEVAPLGKAKPEGRICVVLMEHRSSFLKNPSEAHFKATKEIFLKAAGVLWATRGASPSSTDPHMNLVQSFARATRAIRGQSIIATVDFDSQKPLPAEQAASVLFKLFKHLFVGRQSDSLEQLDTQYAERNGRLEISRLQENHRFGQSIYSGSDILQVDRLLRYDATYIVVGDFASSTVGWLIENGARHIIYYNVHEFSTSEKETQAQSLEHNGLRATISHCDITHAESFTKMIEDRRGAQLPICGVVYGVTNQDAPQRHFLGEATHSEYISMLRPRITELWSLHNYLPKDLEFFVTMSAVSAKPGQVTHVADIATAVFLDSFASYRDVLGLSTVALTIDKEFGAGQNSQRMTLLRSAIGNASTHKVCKQIVVGPKTEL